jgi:DNA-binding MarR family transcriptional regulator
MRSLAPDVTEGPRADILECVSRTPGAHLRGIERMTGLPLGQVLYHLDRLERMGLVVSSKDAGFRRYYLTKDVGRNEKRYLAALRHAVPRRIVLALLETPGLTHKDLTPLLGVAGSTLSFHLERLLASGVLVREKVGAALRYRVSDPDVARWELIFYRESFADPEVDRFVKRVLASLPGVSPPAPPSPAASGLPLAAPLAGPDFAGAPLARASLASRSSEPPSVPVPVEQTSS